MTPTKIIVLALTIILLVSCGQYYKGELSDHFDGQQFFNPGIEQTASFASFLSWQFNSNQGPWPSSVKNTNSDKPPARVLGDQLRISFVNHATVLIQTQGMNILTDPVWSERVSPIGWAGPKRIRPAGIAFKDLPKIDIIVVGHNHYDHLDIGTLRRLCERDELMIVVPLGNESIIKGACPDDVIKAIDWGDSHAISDSMTIGLEPTVHWSSRRPFDRNKALWGAFVILSDGGHIYFTGDTGFGGGKYFKEAAEKYGGFRVALLPIGAYEPRWFMKGYHMNPEEAVLAHVLLNAKHSLAIHYGTFRLSDEAFDAPIRELRSSMAQHSITQEQFRAIENGDYWLVP